ncbi:5-methyltetrahydrofolate--homocysteine methyltransferase [Lachnospiraceae bacterium RM5]|nr:5-methyltetrahydrofolate--homocysteine methyltransferase [Lachnospiraceae bacterium RM5]
MEKEHIELKFIDKSETIRYMGYKDSIPDVAMTKIILEQEENVLKNIKPDYTYKVFDIEEDDGKIHLKGTNVYLQGESIKEHLKYCNKAVIMCATLSDKLDKLLRQAEVSNMLNALIIDALANAAIEQVCDKAEDIILKNFKDYKSTWRFGVGYGDFPLSQQGEILNILNAGKLIGVCMNESFILTPRKSVTCVIGLSDMDKDISTKKTCKNCQFLGRCKYREKNEVCYGE